MHLLFIQEVIFHRGNFYLPREKLLFIRRGGCASIFYTGNYYVPRGKYYSTHLGAARLLFIQEIITCHGKNMILHTWGPWVEDGIWPFVTRNKSIRHCRNRMLLWPLLRLSMYIMHTYMNIQEIIIIIYHGENIRMFLWPLLRLGFRVWGLGLRVEG